jgi:hypothetical protein
MRSIGDPAFFRLFEALVAEANPRTGAKRPGWDIDDSHWTWERHTFSGASHGFTMEVCTIARPGPRGWTLLVVKEFWWIADHHKPLRELHWAKLISGNRADAIRWLAAHDCSQNG